jgi:hypothetical protein
MGLQDPRRIRIRVRNVYISENREPFGHVISKNRSYRSRFVIQELHFIILYGKNRHRVQNASGAHPASYPVGTRDSFPGVKRPGREADHSPPSSAEVKEWVELYLHSPNTPSSCGA